MWFSISLCVVLTQYFFTFAVAWENYEDISPYRYLYACQYQLRSEATFCPPTNESCPCLNPNFLASVAGCLEANVDGTPTSKMLYAADRNCEYYNVTLADDWYETSLKLYHEKAKKTSDIPNFNITKIIDIPIIMNHTRLIMFQTSYKNFYNNYQNSLYYGAGILAYWALVLVMGAVINWGKFLFPGTTKRMTYPIVNYWRKYVTIPATFRKKKAQDQQFLKIFG
ncbi:CFEM domain-containing protein, partial [Acetobacter pasteurianus]|nr:CFEM domain-containing protein [Acetobacter pasteurianus]